MSTIYGIIKLYRYNMQYKTYEHIKTLEMPFPTIFKQVQDNKQYATEGSAYKWECYDSKGEHYGTTYSLNDF